MLGMIQLFGAILSHTQLLGLPKPKKVLQLGKSYKHMIYIYIETY